MIKKRIKSFVYAFRGLLELFQLEPNAKIHLVAAVAVITSGLLLDISNTDWTLIIIVIGMVFTAELFNTAIEVLCNKVSPDYDQMIKEVKDYAAAGVLVAAICAALVGAIVFLPYLI